MPALRNDQHERFCQAMLLEKNGTKAALAADYSPSFARQQAHKLLKRQDVIERIAELKAERAERTNITSDMVLEELAIVGHSNPEDYHIDDNGNLSVKEGVDPRAMRAISSMEVTISTDKDGTVTRKVKYRFWSKTEALKMEGQHHNLFTEKHEHVHKGEVRFVPPTVVNPRKQTGVPPAQQKPEERTDGA